jgi:hypothetical protein
MKAYKKTILFLIYSLVLLLTSCGGGGGSDSSADGRWSGIWQTDMPLHQNTCPFVPATVGLPNEAINARYTINQDGSSIAITNGSNSAVGQTIENGDAFLVDTTGQLSSGICSNASYYLAIQFFNLDGNTAGSSYTYSVQCAGVNQCFIGYVGSAERL